ncbi:MAG: SDR family oxidoreductase [Anaerolineae bacterium]|nr:SDR family oxidoreductase [Anaerolineae bacterium]
MRLKNKVAIITGAGRGIGRATALRFAEEGAMVVLADIDFEIARAVADEINLANNQDNGRVETMHLGNGGSKPHVEPVATLAMQQALPFQVDVTDQSSVAKMVETTVEYFGRIDILINNAGIVRDAQLVNMTEEVFDLVIDINLKGVYNCAHAVAPVMINQGSGVILSTASVVAPYGNFGQTNYVASKAGLVGMTKVWARELGRKGIRANTVAPGFIKTRLTEGIPDKVIDKIKQRIPLGHLGEPEDVANAFVWLASDEARYVTGHSFAVDGGAVI